MAKVLTRTSKVAIFVAMLATMSFARSKSLSDTEVAEIREGFRQSVACITTNRYPSEWCVRFRQLIFREEAKNTSAFLLGANFGFSFKSEPTAESSGANEDELRKVAACAANARLAYELNKAELRVTDRDIINILKVSPGQFAGWKARLSTGDPDNSVTHWSPGTDL